MDVTQAVILPPREILRQYEDINIAAPMVRYSKLPFRHLVSLYDVHITHTPMILAREFSRSSIARSADFSSSHHERGLFLLRPKGGKQPTLVRGALVAQFAATEPRHLADAAELISPWVDGIDLNCGCPQPWAYTEHIGSWLLRKPEVVYDLVRATKDRLGWNFSVSIKIRVDEPKQTERLIQTAIRAGVDYVTVHGRTRHQASTAPVNLPTIRFAVDAAKGEVPIVANGDAWSMEDVLRIRTETVAQGVMSARGLLANPALFAGYRSTPAEAITRFVEIATSYGGLPFALFHRHIACMLEERLGRAEKTYFNSLTSHAGVLDYLEGRGLSLPK